MPPPPGRSSHRVREKDVGAPPRCADPRNPGAFQQARGRMESHRPLLLHAAPDVAADRAANPRAAVPSSRQEGGDQGGSAKAGLPLAEAAPPRQSRTVLQPLRSAATNARTRILLLFPRAPRPTQSPPTLALLVLTRLDPWPHRCPASFPSTAGAEKALPKPREQSLVEATGGGGRT